MRLTRFTDYALRALIYLGLHEPQQSSIAEIARAYGISESHLTKVVHQLGRLGLIRTTRGRGGGLRLGRRADEIVIGAVVRQTEDDLALVECFAGGACAITAPCRLRRALGRPWRRSWPFSTAIRWATSWVTEPARKSQQFWVCRRKCWRPRCEELITFKGSDLPINGWDKARLYPIRGYFAALSAKPGKAIAYHYS